MSRVVGLLTKADGQIGRGAGRGRGENSVGGVSFKKKKKKLKTYFTIAHIDLLFFYVSLHIFNMLSYFGFLLLYASVLDHKWSPVYNYNSIQLIAFP